LIEIADNNTATWTSDPTNCDGSSASVLASLQCVIPMATLQAAPYNYAFTNVVVVRVSAANVPYGLGEPSPPSDSINGAQIRIVPA